MHHRPIISIYFVAFLFSSIASADERSEMTAIQTLGGTVRSTGNADDLEVEFQLRGRALTDEGLAHVAVLDNVVSLNLRDTKITGAGLVHLKGLTELRWLHLERTTIGDEGVEHLAGLSSLEYLNLYGTKITDKSLEHLTGLKNLRNLYVWQTGVTDEGVARLEKALPELKIVRGVDLSKLPAAFPAEADMPKPKLTLKWTVVKNLNEAPQKSTTGLNVQLFFENKSEQKVKIYWIMYGGGLKLYHELEPGKTRQQNTYSNNAWLITDSNDQPLGYFVAKPDDALAVIPKPK